MKVGFVCTNYNNSSFTREAVASLHAGGQWRDGRIVIVDNGSSPDDVGSLKKVASDFSGVELVLNSQNVGYFCGLNIGIRYLRANFPEVNLVVVGNNDLVFPRNFVDRLGRASDVLETWAVVAPDLVTPDGIHQNPHVLHPLSVARKLVWDLYALSFGTATLVKYAARITRRFTVREENSPRSQLHEASGPIEQGYGACYLLGPVFFRHFTQLFAPTFLIYEEFFLYEQLKAIGQLTYYDPRILVYHRGHAATDAVPSRRLWIFFQNAHRIYKRYLAMPLAERRRVVVAGSGMRSQSAPSLREEARFGA